MGSPAFCSLVWIKLLHMCTAYKHIIRYGCYAGVLRLVLLFIYFSSLCLTLLEFHACNLNLFTTYIAIKLPKKTWEIYQFSAYVPLISSLSQQASCTFSFMFALIIFFCLFLSLFFLFLMQISIIAFSTLKQKLVCTGCLSNQCLVSFLVFL